MSDSSTSRDTLYKISKFSIIESDFEIKSLFAADLLVTTVWISVFLIFSWWSNHSISPFEFISKLLVKFNVGSCSIIELSLYDLKKERILETNFRYRFSL